MKKGVTIGVDASRCTLSEATGVEFYSRKLLAAFKSIKEVRDGSDIIYYTPHTLDPEFIDHEKHIGQIVIPFKRLWTQIRLSFEMLIRPTRVLFVPSHTLPLIHPRRSAIMIHDVAFRHFPESYTWFARTYLHFSTWYACKFARLVLTCSTATADDLRTHYGISSDRITTIPHGPGHLQELQSNPSTVSKLPFKGSYLLFLGRIEEKKNLIRTIEAFALFRGRNHKHHLVLAGKPGVGFRGIQDTVERLGLSDVVHFTGYVPSPDARALVEGAEALLLPSLYEGFGFPILEAFALKTPVITSQTSSMPEVAGAGALLVDPRSIQGISHAMERIVSDETLRSDLIATGLKRSQSFCWEKAARKTYSELVRLGFTR